MHCRLCFLTSSLDFIKCGRHAAPFLEPFLVWIQGKGRGFVWPDSSELVSTGTLVVPFLKPVAGQNLDKSGWSVGSLAFDASWEHGTFLTTAKN